MGRHVLQGASRLSPKACFMQSLGERNAAKPLRLLRPAAKVNPRRLPTGEQLGFMLCLPKSVGADQIYAPYASCCEPLKVRQGIAIAAGNSVCSGKREVIFPHKLGSFILLQCSVICHHRSIFL